MLIFEIKPVKKPPFQGMSPAQAWMAAYQDIAKNEPDKLTDYMSYHRIVDSQGRYQHFDKFRFRVSPELNADWAWAILRFARAQQLAPLIYLGEPATVCHYLFTPSIQQALSMVDRYTSASALDLMSSRIGEKKQLTSYLLRDLLEDEAISSSQLEGAATTTVVAKEMIKHKRKPRTADEKMILGNFKMMNYAWEQRHQALSLDLIEQMHLIGTEGIDDDKYTPGQFRRTDNIVVVKNEEVVHQPPLAKGLKQRINQLINWVNQCHDDAEHDIYVHPLIKAITLHFAIGYEHPFRDGNGRVARGLFYWYMFKCDYTAFRYIAISALLKKAPVQYGTSYLYTETDGMDLTYFIDYQSRIILRAIKAFLDTYHNIRVEREQFERWLWDSGLYKKLSDKQRELFNVAKDDHQRTFTIREVEENFACSYNTAAAILNGLVNLGIFDKRKNKREWHYFLINKQELQNNWRGSSYASL